jgi:hypothetical protein
MIHEYQNYRPTRIVKGTLYTMHVFSLKGKSNVFPVQATKAYEVVEVYLHSFLCDCSKLQEYRALSKYLRPPNYSLRVSG